MRKIKFSPLLMLFIGLAILSGCESPRQYTKLVWPQENEAPAAAPPSTLAHTQSENDTTLNADGTIAAPPPIEAIRPDLPPAKVALLLPLSGANAALGSALLQSAQMALFEIGHKNLKLMPIDTQGTAEGSVIAAQKALDQNAQLIIGPLFAHSVKAVKPIAKRGNVKVIAFSTDWSLADSDTFIMGFLPFDQVERIVAYSASQGYQHLGIINPATAYGSAIAQHFKHIAPQYGATVTKSEDFSPLSRNLNPTVRSFTDFDDRTAAAEKIALEQLKARKLAEKNKGNDEAVETSSEDIDKARMAITPPFNAVFMPVGGEVAITLSNLLSQYDLPPRSARRLGVGLFDDPALANEPSLRNAWFAAPSPAGRQDFETRYRLTFGQKPPRLSTLAYDATALAAVLARSGLRQNGIPAFNTLAITNPNGFVGIDGIFRFHRTGLVQRGLAVLEYKSGKIVEIDPAPTTFQSEQTDAVDSENIDKAGEATTATNTSTTQNKGANDNRRTSDQFVFNFDPSFIAQQSR